MRENQRVDMDDPSDSWWHPGALDERFTEDDPHFQAINKKIIAAQLSPGTLRRLPDDDLVYIAGHVHDPWDPDPEGQEAADRAHKSKQNAERARVELQRRYAAKQARASFHRQVALVLLGAVLGIFSTLLVNQWSDSDEEPPPATSTQP